MKEGSDIPETNQSSGDSTARERDELATDFFSLLPFDPYPVQEEALLAWFTAAQGILVCAPTGTGKTLIAEAAVYEALRTDRVCYYTTPLIALTEQKFQELTARAVSWGFAAEDVGLVTGNRRVNPDAKVLVVVAEILLNRLLQRSAEWRTQPHMLSGATQVAEQQPEQPGYRGFDFGFVQSVVMDEFHSFSDPERGIVWELTLGLLPAHVRTMLLSATVGNAYDFSAWLRKSHRRDLQLVQSTDRKVPLSYHWISDQLLTEQLESMAQGPEETRFTPALVFCFNREECWNVADQLRGKRLLDAGRQSLLDFELRRYDWTTGIGPKLKQLLLRGVGVHHAGVLPKYRRIVEEFFEKKLLSVVVCTETLAAGINLPARSVALPGLVKGPPDKRRLIEVSAAQQMFGRAGRPQFDTQGHVFALAHEDDVKILRWKERYDQIPDNPKDPQLRKAKKSMAKKMPKRRSHETYWTEAQFRQLIEAPPSKLASRSRLPWRLLGHVLEFTSDVHVVRDVVEKRLMPPPQLEAGQRQLDRMLHTLWRAGYVTLEPEPPRQTDEEHDAQATQPQETASPFTLFGQSVAADGLQPGSQPPSEKAPTRPAEQRYRAERAIGTELLPRLQLFRSVNPLYGVFLTQQLGAADNDERMQALESVLDLPGSIARFVRVPPLAEMPPGILARTRLDEMLLRLGLANEEDLLGSDPADVPDPKERVWPLKFAEKLRLLFQHDFPGVDDVAMQPVWAAGEILRFGGDFQAFILNRRLQRQEGMIFRHLLRLILLLAEFTQLTPPDCEADTWRNDLLEIRDQLAIACQHVDETSTQKTLEESASREHPAS